MRLIKVRLKAKGYDIVIGNNILGSFSGYLKKLRLEKTAIVVTNPIIRDLWGARLRSALSGGGFNAKFEVVADSEQSKSIKSCFGLLEKIADYGKLTTPFIIAFGGGVIGDLAGFVASAYKRGIPYVQLPTTLVSQVDSAIGGKVAVDLKLGKNLVGSFYQPRLVFSETDFLRTLPAQQAREGLAEIIKYGVIKDAPLFQYLEKNIGRISRLEKEALEFVIERSSRIKADIVAKDEFDKLGLRAVLNYGHTIGHAIESASGYSKNYTHGKAVSIGMVAANTIALELGLITEAQCLRIKSLLIKAGLPVSAKGLNPSKIYAAHLYDKKFQRGKNRFVLPLRIGKVKICEGIPEAIIKRAIGSICKNRSV